MLEKLVATIDGVETVLFPVVVAPVVEAPTEVVPVVTEESVEVVADAPAVSA
jgi:hypothetical protein